MNQLRRSSGRFPNAIKFLFVVEIIYACHRLQTVTILKSISINAFESVSDDKQYKFRPQIRIWFALEIYQSFVLIDS